MTILVAGLSMDFAWQKLEPHADQKSQLVELVQTHALLLEQLPEKHLDQKIDLLNKLQRSHYQLIHQLKIKQLGLHETLASNQPLLTENEDQMITFLKLKNHPFILQITTQVNSSPDYLKPLFILLFYSIIAIMVFFWIWPLSKDLNRLEKAVSNFSGQQWQSEVELPATSSVAHLAKAYNELLERIKLLIETQQSMSHSISHELRTPLARIRFALQMADESENSTEIKSQLQSVMEDVEEMNQLITELLNFAALEKISVEAKLERGNINLLIENLLSRLCRNNHTINISFELSEQGNHVLCDSYLIERALQNLIVNAQRFAKRTIKVAFHCSSTHYQLLVEDDGPGIPNDKKSLVFDSFVQLPSNNKDQGFGLGLAIVKRVMNLHRGEAVVKDSQLGGAAFILAWPKPDV
jgi:two-component system, OmpR family, sensor kinase